MFCDSDMMMKFTEVMYGTIYCTKYCMVLYGSIYSQNCLEENLHIFDTALIIFIALLN